jgi:hypothetical protein
MKRTPALRSRAIGSIMIALLLGLIYAVPAQAEGNTVFRDHFSMKDSHIEQEAHDDFCDVPFLVRWSGRFTVTETVTRKGGGELEYGSFHSSASDTWTNVETGASFHTIGSFSTRDQKLTWNGDGTLSVAAMDRFSTKLFDGDGKLVAIDAGLVAVHLVIDLNNVDDPEDDTIISETVTKDHGIRTFGERDFCADLVAFIG